MQSKMHSHRTKVARFPLIDSCVRILRMRFGVIFVMTSSIVSEPLDRRRRRDPPPSSSSNQLEVKTDFSCKRARRDVVRTAKR
jgi:hypothetical protein